MHSLWLLFIQYKTTWLTTITGHCLAALSDVCVHFNSKQQHVAKHLLSELKHVTVTQ